MNFLGINSPFARGMNKLVQMLYAGLLWFVCSLPVVTMGASTTALFEVLLKMEKDQEGYIGASFLRAFRKNFKSSTLVFLPILFTVILFGVNLFYYAILGGGKFPVQCAVFGILFFMALAVSGYAFPVTARFENDTKGTFRVAFTLALRNFGWTIVIVILRLVTVFVCWCFLWFPIIFIMGLMGYAEAVIFNHIFDKLIEEGKITEVYHGQ